MNQDIKKENNDMPLIEDEKKHATIVPVLILDIDKGLDFTFDGLGLKGNKN